MIHQLITGSPIECEGVIGGISGKFRGISAGLRSVTGAFSGVSEALRCVTYRMSEEVFVSCLESFRGFSVEFRGV